MSITIGSVVRVAFDFQGEAENEELRIGLFFEKFWKISKSGRRILEFFGLMESK